MDLALAAQKGMIAGWPWMLAKPIFCVFFSYTGYCPYLSGTTISLLVDGHSIFLFWRGLMESRFNLLKYIYIYIFYLFFWLREPSGDMSCVRVDRSQPITIFCCSVRPMFSVMCGLSCFFVYGCRLFTFLCVFVFLQQTFILLSILHYF